MNDVLNYVRLLIDIVLFAGLGFFSYKFYKLQDVVILSFKDALAILIIISRYKNLEQPERYLARLTGLSEEEAKLELDRGRLMDMLSDKANSIISNMKASVRGSSEMVTELEACLGR